MDEPMMLNRDLLLRYFRISPEDLEALALLREPANQRVDTILDALYGDILSFPETSALYRDAEAVARARQGQRGYFLSLFRGQCDEEYFRARAAIGQSHDRIGVEPWQYCGAVAFYISEMLPQFREALQGLAPVLQVQVMGALVKLLLLDTALVWETFYRARQERLRLRAHEMEALNRFAAQRVNELVDAQTVLERKAGQLRALLEVSHISFQEPQPREAAQRLLDKVVTVMGAEAAELWVVDREAGHLLLVAHHGLYPTEFRQVAAFRLGEGFPGLAAATGEPVVTQDLPTDARFLRREVVREGFRFYAAVPLRAERTVVGVLGVASLRPEEWDDEQARFLEALGKLLGRRTMGLLLQEAHRRQGEATLRQAESGGPSVRVQRLRP